MSDDSRGSTLAPEVYVAQLTEAFGPAEVKFEGNLPHLVRGNDRRYRTLIVRTHLSRSFLQWRLWVEVQNATWDAHREGWDISTVERGWRMTPEGWVLEADDDPLAHITEEWPWARFLGEEVIA